MIVLLSFLFAAAMAGENIVNLASGDPRLSLALFNEFRHSSGRDYPPSEQRMRLTIFRKFIKEAAALNAEEDDVEYGLTVFADLTDAEAANMHGLNMTEPVDIPLGPEADEEDEGLQAGRLGTSHKSRYGPVKNQGRTNACWAFAATGVMEGHAAITNRRYTALSEQETADCTTGGSSIARGGSHPSALQSIQRQRHLATMRDVPFRSRDGSCSYSRYRNALPYTIAGVYQARGDSNLARALSSGPVAGGLAFDRALSMYRNGIYQNTSCNRARPNHAITIIGYTSSYWEIRNSYGAYNWGEGGYGRFTRRINNMCNMSGASFYITVRRSGQVEKEE